MDTTVRDETLRHLVKTGNQFYELIAPHVLYSTPVNSEAYVKQMEKQVADEGESFHRNMRELVETNLDIFMVGDVIVFIDMGPGYPDKTLPLIKELKKRGIKVIYGAVDGSKTFLQVTDMAVAPFIEKEDRHSFNVLFQDLHKVKLPIPPNVPVFFFLGLTYMNFAPDEACNILKSVMTRPGDTAVIASELPMTPNARKKILAQYDSEEVFQFTFGPLANLGFKREQVYSWTNFNTEKERLEFSHTFNQKTKGDGVTFEKGDSVITAISHRQSPKNWISDLNKHFEEVTLRFSATSTGLAFLKNPKLIMPEAPKLIMPN